MTKSRKGGFLTGGAGSNLDFDFQPIRDMEAGSVPLKTVMVYLMDENGLGKEPIGIIPERRKSERDDTNAIGMLQRARKEFAETEDEAQRIVIGDYV